MKINQQVQCNSFILQETETDTEIETDTETETDTDTETDTETETETDTEIDRDRHSIATRRLRLNKIKFIKFINIKFCYGRFITS